VGDHVVEEAVLARVQAQRRTILIESHEIGLEKTDVSKAQLGGEPAGMADVIRKEIDADERTLRIIGGQ